MADITLWSDEVINRPAEGWPADGRIASTPAQSNNQSSLDSVKVSLQYKAITPDGANALVGFTLSAVIEEEVAPGVWVPEATQFDVVKGTDEAVTQILELTPGLNLNPGSPEKMFAGGKEVASISRTQGKLGSKWRVCIVLQVVDPNAAELDSLTISGYARTFNLST